MNKILFNIKSGFYKAQPRLNIQAIKAAGNPADLAVVLYKRGYCCRVLAGNPAARWKAAYRAARAAYPTACNLSLGARWALTPKTERAAARLGMAAYAVMSGLKRLLKF